MHLESSTPRQPKCLQTTIGLRISLQETPMQTLIQDIRFALRQILRTPGFSLTAVLSLTLGIGATVAVYSILYDAVLHPWPYAGFDRVCQVWLADKAGHDDTWRLTGPQVRQIANTHAVDDVFAVDQENLIVTGSDVPDDVRAVDFTGNDFRYLGLPAMLGRSIGPSDAPEGQDPQPVAVLSYTFWQKYYNGDRGVVGRTIQLSHKSYAILGVMPPRFTWMDADVYLPLRLATDQTNRYWVSFKLKQGVSTAAAESEFQPLFRQFDQQTPNIFPRNFKISVRRMAESYTQQLKGTMFLLFGAVALLLAIGCGNVSILLLARGTARQHEFAVRSAVGASGWRIVRQLLTESLLLSVAGAGLGVLLAFQATSFIVTRLPEYSFPHEADFHINVPVLIFSVALAILSGVLFGLFPALQFSRPEISQVMQASMRRLAGSVRGRKMHTALIAGQIALTLLLMSAAGAAIEGFLHMMRVPLGYDPHAVMSVGIPLRDNSYTTWDARKNYFAQLRDQVAAVPGVTMTGISTNATPPDSGFRVPIDILGRTPQDAQEATIEMVGTDYFTTLRIPLVAGRMWSAADVNRGAAFVVVNQAFVRRYFPHVDPVGHSVRIPLFKTMPPGGNLMASGVDGWLQITAVVGDSLNDGLDKPVAPAVYLPWTLYILRWTQILVRTQGDPLALLHAIRRKIAVVDPDQETIGDVRDLEQWIEREPEVARARLVSMLFGAFSAMALFLAAVGLYSVVSYTVLQRTGELGIRVALGARRGDVLRIVAFAAGTSVGLGIIAGLVLSFSLNHVVARWVESGAADPLMVLLVAVVLIAVAAIACFVPARRALAIDPITALRYE
jgi:putative ABC transport system permease protein